MKLNRLCFTLILCILTLVACQKPQKVEPPKVKAGVLDLSGWDFERHGNLKLFGKWEFYWEQFLTPKDFHQDLKTSPLNPVLSPMRGGIPMHVPVPSNWNAYEKGGNALPGRGHATYRLKIRMETGVGQMLSLKVPPPSTAYRLWINGNEMPGNGVVGTNAEEMTAVFRSRTATFVAEQENEVIFQVSNYLHREGGMWQVPIIGTVTQIQRYREKDLQFELFLMGSLLIMGLYHLGLFVLRHKEPSPLYFGLFCLDFALRAGVTGERVLANYFADDWKFTHTLEYLTFYVSPTLFIMFVYALFPKECSKLAVRFCQTIGMIFCLIVILTPAITYTATLKGYQLLTVVLCLYIIYVLCKAAVNRREGAGVFLAGFVVLFATVINDLLVANQIIYTGFWVPFGLFLFIFFQSFVLSMKFSRAFAISEDLTEHLEQKVEHRTHELHRALEETTEKEKEITHINQVVQTVNSSLNLEQVLEAVTRALEGIFRFDIVGILLRDEAQKCLTIHHIYGEPITEEIRKNLIQLKIPFDSKDSTQTWIINSRSPLYVNNAHEQNMLPIDKELHDILPF